MKNYSGSCNFDIDRSVKVNDGRGIGETDKKTNPTQGTVPSERGLKISTEWKILENPVAIKVINDDCRRQGLSLRDRPNL